MPRSSSRAGAGSRLGGPGTAAAGGLRAAGAAGTARACPRRARHLAARGRPALPAARAPHGSSVARSGGVRLHAGADCARDARRAGHARGGAALALLPLLSLLPARPRAGCWRAEARRTLAIKQRRAPRSGDLGPRTAGPPQGSLRPLGGGRAPRSGDLGGHINRRRCSARRRTSAPRVGADLLEAAVRGPASAPSVLTWPPTISMRCAGLAECTPPGDLHLGASAARPAGSSANDTTRSPAGAAAAAGDDTDTAVAAPPAGAAA